MSTVIIGGGIIGVATAYYLTRDLPHGRSDVHIVESSTSPFLSASGFAGGFVAPDWFPAEVLPLGRLSYRLHEELAAEFDGKQKWGYNKTSCLSLTEELIKQGSGERGDEWIFTGASRSQAATGIAREKAELKPTWMRDTTASFESLGDAGACIQVDPRALSQFLLTKCQERGAQFHLSSTIERIICSRDGAINSVSMRDNISGTEQKIACDKLVLTAGAWTGQVFTDLFPRSKEKISIGSIAGYSLLLQTPSWKENQLSDEWHAIFCSAVGNGDKDDFSAELFARRGPSGEAEIYVGGLNDRYLRLPNVPTGEPPDNKFIDILMKRAQEMLSIELERQGTHSDKRVPNDSLEIANAAKSIQEGKLSINRASLCWRPTTAKGYAYIGEIPDEALGDGTRTSRNGGVWLAAGHGPWGISLSLGTGKVLSEKIQGKIPSCNIEELAPFGLAAPITSKL